MAESVSLYATLGIDSAATAEQIKTAYRAKARVHHPDRPTGDAERFKTITIAFEVLSDPARRERYDRTGETAARERVNARIESEIAAMLMDAFMQDGKDPVRWMLDQLDRKRSRVSQQRDECRTVRKKLLRKTELFTESNKATKNADGRNFILEALQARLAEFDRGIAAADDDHKHYTDSMAFLNDLKVDRKDPWSAFSSMGPVAFYGWDPAGGSSESKLYVPGMDD